MATDKNTSKKQSETDEKPTKGRSAEGGSGKSAGKGPAEMAKPETPNRVTRGQAEAKGPEGSTNPPSAIDDRFEDANAGRAKGHASARTRQGQAKRDQY